MFSNLALSYASLPWSGHNHEHAGGVLTQSRGSSVEGSGPGGGGI